MTPEQLKEISRGVEIIAAVLTVEKLTKREILAAASLIGLLAHADSYEGPPPPSHIALQACAHADAILKEFARVGDVGADVPATPPGP